MNLSPDRYQPAGPSPQTKIIVVLLLFLTVAVGFLLTDRFSRRGVGAQIRPVTPRGDLGGNEKATIELFQKSSDSVVHITTLAQSRVFSDGADVRQGTGSGFVWDDAGHIVTNYHVVENASEFIVTFADQSTLTAELVGRAPHKDLAVLRVDALPENLKPIAIGESSDLQVGQSVLAIGNPFGLDQTLTTGIISGLGREIRSTTERKISDVVQTDAAINPGNSGGPLLDSTGRLIGVNTAIASTTGASGGVGFAIPVDTVRRVIPELIRHQRVVTPALGIMPVSPRLTQRVGMKGVLVKLVAQGGPADQAGIKPFRYNQQGHILYGDLIVAMNDQQVNEIDDLHSILESLKVGDAVQVRVVRSPNTVIAEDLVFHVTLGSTQ